MAHVRSWWLRPPPRLDAPRHLWVAGLLILASYLIDWCDGALARTLHASTAFGLQLDSLVDMVSLGVAPAVLLFMYGIRVAGVSPWLCGPVVVLVPLAGAFRLARFNLLPPKTTSHTDSVGLTISTGGALLALAVLSNLAGAVAPSPVLYLCVTVGVPLDGQHYRLPLRWPGSLRDGGLQGSCWGSWGCRWWACPSLQPGWYGRVPMWVALARAGARRVGRYKPGM